VGERLSYSARAWEGKLPVGHFLINLYWSPVEGFIRNFFLINPFQRRLSGKVSDYRDLGGKSSGETVVRCQVRGGKTKESFAEFRRGLGEQISYTVGHIVHFLARA